MDCRIRLLLCTTAALLGGCATAESYVPPPAPSSTFSASSSYVTSSYDSVSVAAVSAQPGEKVVRPDHVLQAFTLRAKDEAPEQQLQSLKAAHDELAEKLREATGGAAKILTHGARLERHGGGKSGGGDYATYFDGAFQLELPPEADFWERARLLTSMQRLSGLVSEQGLGKEGAIAASFGVPNPGVANPEAHREELVRVWTERVHAFAKAAQSGAAPLAVTDCNPPVLVTQRPLSIEQVALSLPFNCRLVVPRAQ